MTQLLLHKSKIIMDSGAIQDQFIQKKLLYKFDKKIDLILQQYYRRICAPQQESEMIDESQTNCSRAMTKQQLLEQIDQLMFQNFKYRTAILSAKKDQQFNDQILQRQQDHIIKTKQQIKLLSNDLNNAITAKRHKQQYNVLAKTIKKYEGKVIQDKKLKSIEDQIKIMEQNYQNQMYEYKKKQKCLKMALAALKGVIDWDANKDTKQQDRENNKQKQLDNQNTMLAQKNQREEGESDVLY